MAIQTFKSVVEVERALARMYPGALVRRVSEPELGVEVTDGHSAFLVPTRAAQQSGYFVADVGGERALEGLSTADRVNLAAINGIPCTETMGAQ